MLFSLNEVKYALIDFNVYYKVMYLILAVTSVQLYPLAAIKEYLASIGLSRLSNYNNQAGVTYCLIASRDDPSVNRDVLANQHYGPVFLSHVWKAKKIPGIDVSLDGIIFIVCIVLL